MTEPINQLTNLPMDANTYVLAAALNGLRQKELGLLPPETELSPFNLSALRQTPKRSEPARTKRSQRAKSKPSPKLTGSRADATALSLSRIPPDPFFFVPEGPNRRSLTLLSFMIKFAFRPPSGRQPAKVSPTDRNVPISGCLLREVLQEFFHSLYKR